MMILELPVFNEILLKVSLSEKKVEKNHIRYLAVARFLAIVPLKMINPYYRK